MSRRTLRPMRVAAALLSLMVISGTAGAEPYLAVFKGLKCGTCHTAPSGGGLRTVYGNVYAQTELPARTLDLGNLWKGELGRYFAVGGDVRGGWREIDTPGQPSVSETELQEFLAYAEIRPFPKYLSLYIDARLLPDDVLVREQYVRAKLPGGKWALRYGDFFLPFGWRLQDDDAFVRAVGGINYNTPDRGVELQYESGTWSAQLAVTRGTAGGPEVDSGKQYSLRVSHVRPDWRVGGSFNFNDAKAGDRQMQNLFAGIRTGPVAWLGEIDYIIDYDTPTGRRGRWASLVEANWGYRKGHNLKLTLEWSDPDADVDEDEQNRVSLVWEYLPIQFVQARLGLRYYDGIPQNPVQNRQEAFAELHLLF